MSYQCIIKNVFGQISVRNISVYLIFCVISFTWSLPALGQIFSYSPYAQPYLSLFSNPFSYTFNTSYNRISPYSGINPNIGLYNPFLLLNAFNSINSTSLYPQANLAGNLIPITGFYANPFAYPYNAAGAYFAAAVTPVDVAGTWSGVWTSTFLAGGVTTGDLSITLAQVETDVTGTLAFFLNKILKFGADVVGTVSGNTLNLTSTVIPAVGGTKSFDVTITATVNAGSMEGTYFIINNVTGNTAEEGTFYANRL